MCSCTFFVSDRAQNDKSVFFTLFNETLFLNQKVNCFYNVFFFGGKKKCEGLYKKYLKIARATCLSSESGIFRERKASPSDKLKLTIKLTKPISPIPRIDHKNISCVT